MFTGIPAGMQAFMSELRERNDKSWYDAHKPEYQKLVRQPFTELTLELGDTVRGIDPRIQTEPRRCISRARRDTRFTKDQMFYRNNVWIGFKPQEDRWDLPLFFFEVMPDYFRYGLAFTWESPAFMRTLREYIADCPNDFRKAVGEARSSGVEIDAQCYKRPKDDAPKGFEEWYTYKEFFWTKNRTDCEILQTRDFLPDVEQVFRSCAHFYEIMTEVSNGHHWDD